MVSGLPAAGTMHLGDPVKGMVVVDALYRAVGAGCVVRGAIW